MKKAAFRPVVLERRCRWSYTAEEMNGEVLAQQKEWFSGEFTAFLRITPSSCALLYEFLC